MFSKTHIVQKFSDTTLNMKKYRPPMTRKITETNSVNSSNVLGLQRVNQYTILKQLGQGAYGGVFLAIEPQDDPFKEDKQYAIKIIEKSKVGRV